MDEQLTTVEGAMQPEVKIVRRSVPHYVGFANLPKQWHRESLKRGFSFNLLCVGKRGLGKSTLINTLINRNLYNDINRIGDQELNATSMEGTDDEEEEEDGSDMEQDGQVRIGSVSTLIEENGVKLKLTVVDAIGFGDAIDNTEAWRPIVEEINSRFDQYLNAENEINRSTIEDNRLHACLYFIEPTAHVLKPLDIEFCKQIHDKCNLIPVIAKSDVLTDEEITSFKSKIKDQLHKAGVNLFQPPSYKTDDKDSAHALFTNMPYAIVGSTSLVPNNEGQLVRGRVYPWGVIEIDSSEHCDFLFLRDLLIRHYMEELKERTSKELYEKYRTNKLVGLGIKQDSSAFKEFDPETRQKEDKQLHEAKLARLKAEMKTVFQNKVAEKEKKLQKSEADLFSRHKEMKDKLVKQLKSLEEKKHQLELSLANQHTHSPIQKKKGFLRS